MRLVTGDGTESVGGRRWRSPEGSQTARRRAGSPDASARGGANASGSDPMRSSLDRAAPSPAGTVQSWLDNCRLVDRSEVRYAIQPR
ncbi:hypothetical protein [Lysobacter gummosus]|uniref:hypothetical protein n=1 Tax=Lysobacter gummosus TaxID=262324 RepID=UPI00362E6709